MAEGSRVRREGEMQVLITGGTGFIGRRLTRRALLRGWEVNVLTRDPGGARAQVLAREGARLVPGDITDPSALRKALEGNIPELLFHNAAWYELGIPRRSQPGMWTVNVEATETLLSLAAELRRPKVVYTSTTTALGDTGGSTADESFVRRSAPITFYERTKTEAHQVALRHQAAGERLVIACPAQAIGPGDHSPFGRLARLYARGLLPPFGWAREAAFTFGHVDDVAEALLLVGERGRVGEVYFVAGDEMTNREMLEHWRTVMGRRMRFIWLPRPLALAQSALAAPFLRWFGMPAFLSPEVVRSSYVSFRFRSDKAIRELGARFRTAEEAWEQTLLEEAGRFRA